MKKMLTTTNKIWTFTHKTSYTTTLIQREDIAKKSLILLF